MRVGYLAAGNGLRAFAALAVVLYHAAYAAALTAAGAQGYTAAASGVFVDQFGQAGRLLENANVGVYVFFALTGYFVGGPFVRAWIDGRRGPAPGPYLARRVRRIVPAFWLFALASILVLHARDNSAADIASVLLFVQNQHPSIAGLAVVQAWTLDIEAAFYIALPLLALLVARAPGRSVGRRGRLMVVLGCLAAAALGSLALQPVFPSVANRLSLSLVAMAWAFVPGLALAAVEPWVREWPSLPRLGRALAIALLGASAVAGLAVVHFGPADHVARSIAVASFSGLLLAAALVWQWTTDDAPRWAVNPLTEALGRWSYGIYLAHFAISVELFKLVPDGTSAWRSLALVLPVLVALTVAVAAASWRFVERPILEGRTRARLEPATANRLP
jgi:peptidoglycan/LPS O-acetylase OafA/YrhL